MSHKKRAPPNGISNIPMDERITEYLRRKEPGKWVDLLDVAYDCKMTPAEVQYRLRQHKEEIEIKKIGTSPDCAIICRLKGECR